MPGENKISLLNVNISPVSYQYLIDLFSGSINKREKKIVTYATAHILNICYSNLNFKDVINKFDIVHPDGIGVFLASKFLYKRNGLSERITGSDFYPILISESKRNNWKLFMFGDKDEILSKINTDNLDIVGKISGFDFITESVITNINKSNADILLVGLGSPLQENWIIENKEKINAKIILAVGDGIKVFAGLKNRGPIIMRRLGLEWLVRLFNNPQRLWKRYIFGIPLFIYRVIKYKFNIT